jgi:hypothetical protein
VFTEDANVERLNLALASVGARAGRAEASARSLRRGGRLEIVRRAHAIGHYADWPRGAREHRLGEGLTVVVAALDDILRSKEAAGRERTAQRCRRCAKTSGTPARYEARSLVLCRPPESAANRLRVGTRWEQIASSYVRS